MAAVEPRSKLSPISGVRGEAVNRAASRAKRLQAVRLKLLLHARLSIPAQSRTTGEAAQAVLKLAADARPARDGTTMKLWGRKREAIADYGSDENFRKRYAPSS